MAEMSMGNYRKIRVLATYFVDQVVKPARAAARKKAGK